MKITKLIICFSIVLIIIMTGGCSVANIENTKMDVADQEENTIVAVSIVPQETFVKAVANDLAEVVVLIPTGYSPTNYQPTPKQMSALSESKIFFSIGVATEEANILPKIKDFNKDIKIVSLADRVDEVYSARNFIQEEIHEEESNDASKEEEEHEHSGKDPHIWLSPKRVIIMIEEIKKEFISLDPNNKRIYEKNAEVYINKLMEVDEEIKEMLSGLEQQAFIMYHPSFGYFAEDYGLKMVTIEEEGKEATARKLQSVIDFAKKENIKFIFYQEEFDSQQAETIANEIGGATIKVAPLAPNYIDNLKKIVSEIKEVL